MITDEGKALLAKLAEIRKQSGITQVTMAALMNSNQSHISDLENGKVDPTLRTLTKYCRLLNVRLIWDVVSTVDPQDAEENQDIRAEVRM